jgi:glycolate oxidase
MSYYNKIEKKDLEYFRSVIGNNYVSVNEELLNEYAFDYTGEFYFKPEVILWPGNTNEVSCILSYCNENMIPITPRGAGTSLSGGALAVYGGVSLDMKRFDKILKIDKENLQAIVEPGVINQVFQEAVMEESLYYPPDPASKGSCFLGGNVAHSSGGPHAVKYGTTKDYILNLEIVLPSGQILWTGADTLKYSTGYNLTQLMVGSEGTLGVITKIVTRLIPLPRHSLLMLGAFEDAISACSCVAAIFQEGITPSALEFMERDALIFTINFTGIEMKIPDWVGAHLLIEVDGNYPETLYKDCEKINTILEKYGCKEVLLSQTADEKERLWSLRRKIGEAVRAQSVYREEDTVVPRAYLPYLLKKVKETGIKYGFKSICYGHAGDGNMHINILKTSMTAEDWNTVLADGIKEILQYAVRLKGTISGEHGIGYIQKNFMDLAFPFYQIELMKKIKKVFDPNGILNPGKIFE